MHNRTYTINPPTTITIDRLAETATIEIDLIELANELQYDSTFAPDDPATEADADVIREIQSESLQFHTVTIHMSRGDA